MNFKPRQIGAAGFVANKIIEQWEIDLRAKLEKELLEGCYDVSGGNLVVYTGKQGKIDVEVAFQKEIRRFIHPKTISDRILKQRIPRKKKKQLKK